MIRITRFLLAKSPPENSLRIQNNKLVDSKIAKTAIRSIPRIKSKEEFIRDSCIPFNAFKANHAYRAAQKGIAIEQAYENYTTYFYNQYKYRLNHPDTGSICF